MDKGKEMDSAPTSWIWAIPICLGLLGGILTYIALKDYSQEKANDAIFYGILSTAVAISLYIFFWIILMKNNMPIFM